MIVVHGTWAAPRNDEVRWYQPCDSSVAAADHFTARLDAELQKRGSAARCWAHCTDAHPPFHWSGNNSWIERTHAAVALAEEVAELMNAGWLCHIVAHSHGGNVLVEALQQITARAGATVSGGKLVTLGTPFLDAMAPIVARANTLKRVLNVLYVATAAIMIIAWVVNALLLSWSDPRSGKWLLIVLVVAALHAVVRFVWRPWLVRRREFKRTSAAQGPLTVASSGMDDSADLVLRAHRKKAAAQALLQVPLLAIGSSMDEAWQVLHHLRSLENPLAIKKSLLGYLLDAMRSHASQGAKIARIHGGRHLGELGLSARLMLVVTYACTYISCVSALLVSLYLLSGLGTRQMQPLLLLLGLALPIGPIMVIVGSKAFGPAFLYAFLAPFHWIARSIGAVIGIPAFVTTYIVRRKSWSVLLAMAMGMEGYRFSLPVIAQSPQNFPRELITYEDMPPGAEQRAMEKRNAWIARHLGGVSRTFAKMVISPADLSLLLATIEQDQSLIHAAYYTDDECIVRIADWIAGVR